MLKRIIINGFRGFGEPETIEFSLPNGKPGSGLNIIVGPNNTGKTTITEAMKYFNITNVNRIAFSEGKRNQKNNHRVHISYFNENDESFEIKTVGVGGSQVELSRNTSSQLSVPYVIPARRYVDHSMSNFGYTADRYHYSTNQAFNVYNRSYSLNQFESRIFKWQENKEDFNKILKRIIKEPFEWFIERNDIGSYYIKMMFADKTISHTTEGVGDGFWSVFTLVDALYDAEDNDVIVIDEPELSLHPTFQKRMIELFEEHSQKKQIIISTHSPYFISFLALINGGNLIRTYKTNDGNIKIGELKKEDKKFIKSLMTNLNNPHVLGLEAKELFFIEDNIIITEGQEDVVILPKICETLKIRLNASIFGWGAGGAGNIDKVLRMLKNLNYKKVTAIFDGDQKDKYKKCKTNYPDYNIEILFKDDIRDKKESNIKAKEGITNEKGEIKKENEEEFKRILMRINKYHDK